MFLNNELIHLVFANEDDDYYSGLLRMDLKHFLWLKLHQLNYQAVYYLNADKNTGFTVKTFGDISAKNFSAFHIKTLFGVQSSEDRFGEWVIKQLQDSSCQSAFICPLNEFVQIMEREEWKNTLWRLIHLKRRNGILVLTASPYAEDSAKILLTSPVFEHSKERACLSRPIADMRNLAEQSLYDYLKKHMGNCLFLSTFSAEKIQSILTDICLRNRTIQYTEAQLAQLANYLEYCIHDPVSRWCEGTSGFKAGNIHKYRELRNWLSTSDNFSRLFEASEHWVPEEQKYSPGILRAEGSAADDCIRYLFSHQYQDSSEKASALVYQIYRELSIPKNRLENPKVKEMLRKFISQYNPVKSDARTVEHLLLAIYHWSSSLYQQDVSGIDKIQNYFEESICISQNIYTLNHQLQQMRQAPETRLKQEKLKLQREKIQTQEELLEKLDQGIAKTVSAQFSLCLNLYDSVPSSNPRKEIDEIDMGILYSH